MTISIIVADDHVMFRQGLVNLLRSAPDISIVAECGNGQEAVESIQRLKPDVAVLDVAMPGMDGITAVKTLNAEGVATGMVMLTMHEDPFFYNRALQAGARGFILKEEAFDELLSAIRAVAAGEMAISPTLACRAGFLDELKKAGLTERETQVLGMIACSCTNRMIAADLGISVKTVESHRTNLMNKLDRHSTAELVRYAIKIGLA